MSDVSTLIVIPTYNEREVLADIVRAVREAAPAATVLVVDDNSPDGTGALADQLAAQDHDGQVAVMHRSAKEGLGAAYLAAYKHALGSPRGWQRIVQMDADFSHDPHDVPARVGAQRGLVQPGAPHHPLGRDADVLGEQPLQPAFR